MAYKRKCRWQGLGYKTKSGTNKCVCDRTGEQVFQSYCFNHCDDYEPLPKNKRSVRGNVITISKRYGIHNKNDEININPRLLSDNNRAGR